MALKAGVDVELPSTDVYGAPLVEAVKSGIVPIALVDAVRAAQSFPSSSASGFSTGRTSTRRPAPAHFQDRGPARVLAEGRGKVDRPPQERRRSPARPREKAHRGDWAERRLDPQHARRTIPIPRSSSRSSTWRAITSRTPRFPSGMPKIEDAMPRYGLHPRGPPQGRARGRVYLR